MLSAKDTLLTRPSGGYTIARSVRLRSSAGGYFSRTPATTTNRTTWTWSGWVKRGTAGSYQGIFHSGTTSATGNYGNFVFNSSDQLDLEVWAGAVFATTAVFRDRSAWYHIVLAVDTNQATASNRVKLYVNGVQITAFAVDSIATYYTLSYATAFNQNQQMSIGSYQPYTTLYLDSYLTEINWIDGQQLTPSSFGSTNAVTGVWQPKAYTGTYGTNGFYLNFSDNSNNTATTIGKDSSGNGNNWTPNGISVTAGSTYDSMVDSPTVGSLSSNYCVMNPLDAKGTATLTDGNLTIASAGATHRNRKATFMLPSTGKWYWELTTTATCSASVILGWGLQTTSAPTNATAGDVGTFMGQNDANQDIWNETTNVLSTGSAVAANAIRQVAYDAGTGKLWFGINNVWYSSTDLTSGNPSAGTNQCITLSAGDYFPTVSPYNMTANVNFGQQGFTYTPPTGFAALNTYNLSAPTITNGANYMAATLWNGNSSTQSINNSVNSVSFAPDWVWIKDRNTARSHRLFDTVRGATKALFSDSTDAETTLATDLTAFNSNGFALGAGAGSNATAETYVGWQWKGGGTGVSNTSGSITSTVSANPTAGFSVVTYISNGVNGATIGHGLGVAPSMVIVKTRYVGTTQAWAVYHASAGATQYLILNTTAGATTSSTYWNNTAPSSTVFTIGTSNDVNINSSVYTYVAYCFAPVAGYSAFGSYTGNGSTDGPFVFLGLRPRFIMIKRTDVANDWVILDTSRNAYNLTNSALFPNSSSSETSNGFYDSDIVSNGIKIKASNAVVNASGGTYIYMAFAENPFKYSLAR